MGRGYDAPYQYTGPLISTQEAVGSYSSGLLHHYDAKTFAQLKGMTKKAVDKYNLEKPHSALGRVSPVRYEELLTKNPLIDKRKKEEKKEKFTSSLYYNYHSKVVNVNQA